MTNLLRHLEFSWPSHHAVAWLPGSLPLGGIVPDTPVHTFETSPQVLRLDPKENLKPSRHNYDLDGLLAFSIKDVVTAREADAIIVASERFGFASAAPGISTPPGMRMNKSVHWVADELLLGPVYQRIAHLLPQEIDGYALHDCFSHRINMYRYDDNDVFNRHTDGDWPGYGLTSDRKAMVEWPHLRSALTMLLYLNGPEDGVQGGNTRMYSRDGHYVDCTPSKGAALFFRHGFNDDSVMHEGRTVKGDVPKYVARINVLYKRKN
jgi:hypothetical protein